MKVVINDCYGGFGLSHKAVMRYAELKGIKLYPYVCSSLAKTHERVYGRKPTIDDPDLMFVSYALCPPEELEEIQETESRKPAAVGRYEKSNALSFSPRNIPRDDSLLVKVVRELGKEANARHSKLKIVKIPNDVEWQIEEYDGCEHIAEKHRTWR